MTPEPGTIGSPKNHAPPGMEFRFQAVDMAITESEVRQRVARILGEKPERLVMIRGSYRPTGHNAMSKPWRFHSDGWMIFAPLRPVVY